jgi:dTDP-glucose 4,6-dehydratase
MHPPIAERDTQHILEHTSSVWENLRHARIFLTGGTGFFGKWLVTAFCHACDEYDLKARLCVLTRNPARAEHDWPTLYRHPSVELHQGDCKSFDFPAGSFTHVIHAATEDDSFTSPIPRQALYEGNVSGAQRVLAFAAHAQVQRFLNLSSGAVYGPQPLDLLHISEDSAVAPDPQRVDLAYGHSKRAIEFLVAAHAQQHGFVACSARCFAFVGAFLPLGINYAIGNFIKDALSGRCIRISGDGTPLRSYLYMADLAIWLWTLLVRGNPGRSYNVGSDQAISIAELARLVAAVVNPHAEISIAKAPVPGQPPPRYVPLVERARVELQLRSWVGLSDAIERTATWNRLAGVGQECAV